MPLTLLLLPMLAQVGPGSALPQAPLPERHAKASPTVLAQPNRLKDCLLLVNERPMDAISMADEWLTTAKTQIDRAGASQCLGMAMARNGVWPVAAKSFLMARDNTPAHEIRERARMGALAGNALIASEDMAAALSALDSARTDANAAVDPKLGGVIQIDRARALVALGRNEEAASALKEARETLPDNAQAWLLSATLSRRMSKLAEAQMQIEKAAELLPVDSEIGLEAGVIAVLSGRDEAARKSWQSVLRAAPGSPEAKTAQGYLDQLGPPPAQSGK